MQKKFIIIIVVLMLVNCGMNAFLISKILVEEKRSEAVYARIERRLDDISSNISHVNDAVDEVELQTLLLTGAIYNLSSAIGDSGWEESRNDSEIRVEIWLDENNVVYRTGVSSDVESLTWDILYNGERVLSRNALNETTFEYFRNEPGTYTIYVTSYIDGSYKIVSNIVSYTIE